MAELPLTAVWRRLISDQYARCRRGQSQDF
jgi:hypothetical protein